MGTSWERNETEKQMCKALESVAEQVGAKHITAGTWNFPITYIIVQ